MKKLLLFFVLLATTATGFARDVRIHLTDLLGAPVANTMINYSGEDQKTDIDGYFTISGLTKEGTYHFAYYISSYYLIEVGFEWDGKASTVEVQLNACKVTMALTGLTDKEMELYGNCNFLEVTSEGQGSRRVQFSNGQATFWWESPTLQWSFQDEYHYVGDSRSEVIDLTTETGTIKVNPVKGKYLITIGTVTGHDGLPLTGYGLDGRDPGQGPISYYCYPGENHLYVTAKDYPGVSCTFIVERPNQTIDIDLRDHCSGITVRAIDRDGSPLAGADISFGYQSQSFARTDEKGEYTFYISGNRTSLCLFPNKQFYPSQEHDNILLGTGNVVETFSYEGHRLVSARIIGGARILTDYSDYRMAAIYLRADENSDESSETSLYSEQQGNDILIGRLIDNSGNKWKEARIDLTFEGTSPRILPVTGTYAPLTDDIRLEADLTGYRPVTFAAPEGFQLEEIMVDGNFFFPESDPQSITLYAPQGEHSWTASLSGTTDGTVYPTGKPQAFTVGEESLTVVYPFDVSNYNTVRFTVLDKSGAPFQNMTVAIGNEETASYGRTDENGVCTLYLPEPGTYHWNTDYENEYGFSQEGTTLVGDSPATVTVSYKEWHTFSFNVLGDDIYMGELQVSADSHGTIRRYLLSDRHFSTSLLVPGDIRMSGNVLLTKTRQSEDRTEFRGTLPFTIRTGKSDLTYSIDTDTLYTVKYTINGVDSQDAAHREPFWETSISPVYEENKGRGNWLPRGEYQAVLYDYAITPTYRDTVRFETTDHDMVVNFNYNPDALITVRIGCANVPEGLEDLYIPGYYLNNSYVDPHKELKVTEGTCAYHISSLATGSEETYKEYRTSISGVFNAEKTAGNILIDLGAYRFFDVDFRHENGSGWYSEDNDIVLEAADGSRIALGDTKGRPLSLAMPAGRYNVTVRDYYNKEASGATTLYGTLTVPDDCNGKVTVILSGNPTAVGNVSTAGSTLTATWQTEGLHVSAPDNGPVAVRMYTPDGKLLLDRQVLPNTTVSVPGTGKGVFIVRLKQGDRETCLKFCK